MIATCTCTRIACMNYQKKKNLIVYILSFFEQIIEFIVKIKLK